MNPVIARESFASKLARIGLPLLAAAAVLLALGAVVFAHGRTSGHDDSGDLVSELSELDARVAEHRSRLDRLAEMDLAAELEARRAAAAAAAAAGGEVAPVAPRPVLPVRPVVEGSTTSTESTTTSVEGEDHGVIVLDCDVDSPMGCMER